MKIGFDKLKKYNKIILIVFCFILSLGLVISAFVIENDYIKIALGSAALIVLIFLFLMLVWYLMYQEKFNGKNKYQEVDENKEIDLIVEYPKVYEDYFLRYVYIEGLTLAENLDKIELGEQDFIYVDDVDNKYDNEALALYYKQYKLGYFYINGKFRGLYRKYRDDKQYKIITRVCHLDLVNNKIKVKIAFYKSLESENIKTFKVSIDNNDYEYLKVGYWLDVRQVENAIGQKEYEILDIYGKQLSVLPIKELDELNGKLYAKIIDINEKIDLVIFILEN